MLYLFKKKAGKLEAIALRPTLFVPMTGKAEDKRTVKPDPLNPKLLNGGFEEVAESEDKNFVPGWYYHRLTKWEKDAKAPEGNHYISFVNDISGRASHLLQGFPIDGEKIGELEVSAWVKSEDVVAGGPGEENELPYIALSLYDGQRREVSRFKIGPFVGDEDWHEVNKKFRVPPQAREGIFRLGLYGATGKVSFDNVQMKPIGR
jgi:protein-L-isoaspartate(D-aspartate) O-methyltransferase